MSLPKNFPTDQLNAANRRKLEWFYQRYVEEYYPEYRFGHFLLTAYAAVPALLTPDLLYKLWQNFHQYQWAGRTERIHRVAVSDLLLSPLCREVGFEMYELEPSIRKAFLEWQNKIQEAPLWRDRELASLKAIAGFLQEYHARPNSARQRWGAAYEELQEWNTLAFLQPETLQKRMWQKLQQSVSQNQETETLRVLDFWSKSEPQLALGLSKPEQEQWRQNAQFAQAWKALLQHNTQLFTQAIAQDPNYLTLLNDNPEGGIAVSMPAKIKEEVDRIQEAAKPEPESERQERVMAILVGIDQYLNPDLPRLRGCQNDVADFQNLLENACDYLGMFFEHQMLIDREATTEQVLSSLRSLVNELQDGDHFVFFFSGNAANSLGRDPWEKDGTLFLYDSEPQKTGWSGIRQREIEDLLIEIIQEKKVNCLMVLDHPKLETGGGSKANIESFRDYPLYLKGSLVILYGAEAGQATYEGTFGQEIRGIFPFALVNVFRDKGFNIPFRNLIETVRLRMTQLTDEQTATMEAFPTEMGDALIFAHEVISGEKEYEVSFDPVESRFVLNAGVRQGITPSLEFMSTLIRLEDGRELIVDEVYRDYATLRNFTGDGDTSRKYSATLLQTAFPKIQIAFDPDIDEKMEAQLRSIIQSYRIYYIDIREKLEDAQYFIHSWQNDYFLSRQISSREKNSGAIRPLFNLEPDPFELIKQMEYIAQWSGVVEYQNPNSRIDSRDLHVRIGIIEGRLLSPRNLNEIEPDRFLEDPSSIEVAYQQDGAQSQGGLVQKASSSYQSGTAGDRMLQPGIQVRISSEIKQLIYVSVLYLDSSYGIEPTFRSEVIEPGNELPVPFILEGQTYRTIPLNFEMKNLDLGKSEIYDYLKIFITTEPLDVEPLKQESLELDKQAERTIIVRQRQEQGTFAIGTADWTVLTIPIKIKYRQTALKDPWDAPSQQQTSSATKNIPEDKANFEDYSDPDLRASQSINPEELQVARDMVSKGELKRAMELMQSATKGTNSENEVILLAARLSALERDNQNGVITNDDYRLSRNRITYSLLENIRLIEGA